MRKPPNNMWLKVTTSCQISSSEGTTHALKSETLLDRTWDYQFYVNFALFNR